MKANVILSIYSLEQCSSRKRVEQQNVKFDFMTLLFEEEVAIYYQSALKLWGLLNIYNQHKLDLIFKLEPYNINVVKDQVYYQGEP